MVYGLWSMVFGLRTGRGGGRGPTGRLRRDGASGPQAIAWPVSPAPCCRPLPGVHGPPSHKDTCAAASPLAAHGPWSSVCGLWSMAYGLWPMAHGLWSMACALSSIVPPSIVFGPRSIERLWRRRPIARSWPMAHGLCPMACGQMSIGGPWSVVHGPWSMVYGLWSTAYCPWSMVYCPLPMAHGLLSMVHGPL